MVRWKTVQNNVFGCFFFGKIFQKSGHAIAWDDFFKRSNEVKADLCLFSAQFISTTQLWYIFTVPDLNFARIFSINYGYVSI